MAEPVFFEHFEVERTPEGTPRELGRGAMGVTYKAFDTNLRRPVCLKVINAASLHSEMAQRRFVREARAVARLHHPNVATVFDLGRTGESYFYAMEFVEGETLDARIRREGPLPAALALRITLQVARALGAAHREGLVHRDIKPANLMVVRSRPGAAEEDDGDDDEEPGGGPRVKVIDFGLARASGDDAEGDLAGFSASGIVGTPYFASPEQLDERPVDTRSDIYSLGVTLWFMLAGKPPFAGSSVYQIVSQHLQRPPPFETLAGKPPELIALLGRMLAKEPSARPPDPFALRREIEACLRATSLAGTTTPAAGETRAAQAPLLPVAGSGGGGGGETLLGWGETITDAAPPASLVPAAQTIPGAAGQVEEDEDDGDYEDEDEEDVIDGPSGATPRPPPPRQGLSPLTAGVLITGGLLLIAGMMAWLWLRSAGKTDPGRLSPITGLQNEASLPPSPDLPASASPTPAAAAPLPPLPEFTGATPTSQTLTVPSRQLPTIRAALEAAQPGDTVELRAGVYEESVRFKDGVRLLGAGAEQTIVRVPATSGSVLVVQGCGAGQIAQVRFEHTGAGRAMTPQRAPAVLLENSGVLLVRCQVRDAGGNGITLTAGDHSRVEGCEVSGANGSGIAVSGAKTVPALQANRLHGNRSHGAHWTEGAGGIAEANVCEQNSGAGLAVEGVDTAPMLRGNLAAGNLAAGILYRRGAGGEARGNTVTRNTGSGIDLAGAGTAPTLTDNRCDENQAWGILVQPPAAPTLSGDNRASGNRVGGISAGR